MYSDKEKKREWSRAYQTPEVAARRRKSRLELLELIAGRPKPAVCEVCGDGQNEIVFDHNHRTGNFRGWLCQPCNKAIGHANDNTETLSKLIRYLEIHSDLAPPLESPIQVSDMIMKHKRKIGYKIRKKLSLAQIEEIRLKRKQGEVQAELAKEYNVSQSTISYYIKGKYTRVQIKPTKHNL